MNELGIKYFLLFLIICGGYSSPQMKGLINESEKIDRISGMLYASAIADALSGPYEGRSNEVSQKFLKDGHWINKFTSYNAFFQHHWNVFAQNAPAGTYTDDNRMRLSLAGFMVEYKILNNQKPMSKEYLAESVIKQYQESVLAFKLIESEYKSAKLQKRKKYLEIILKERFLALWFSWELAKTATEVIIPTKPYLYSPHYKRVSDRIKHPEYNDRWHLEPDTPEKVLTNIKQNYHNNTYADGQEMPLGLIHLLPVSIYFPGEPERAFHYILEIDFFDIKNAPYYPAMVCALIADILGGRKWNEISNDLIERGINKYVNHPDNQVLKEIEKGIKKAIRIARKYKSQPRGAKTEGTISFIFELHKEFGKNVPFMCTIQEMLFVPIAIVEYSGDDINFLIELGANYGRDNDTVASIAATIAGALNGTSSLNQNWKEVVQKANPKYDIDQLAKELSKLKIKLD